MMSDFLFDQEYEDICISEANVKEMEAFLLRNHTPYSMKEREEGEVVFSVRAGFDYRDAKIFALKKWGDRRNPDVVNQINNLVLERDFPEPRFEYTQNISDREDCELLNTFVGWENS